MIDLTMDMEQYDCPFIDTTDDHDVSFTAVQWGFDTTARELETRMVVEGRDRSTLESGLETLTAHPHMRQCDLFKKREGTAFIRTVIDETDAMNTIRAHDGYITGPFRIEDGSELWEVGFDRSALDFVAVTHMKRSFHELLVSELGLEVETGSYYLEEYGHVQSADQILALEDGRRAGLLESGDVVCFLAAGTGYTWSASVLTWRG